MSKKMTLNRLAEIEEIVEKMDYSYDGNHPNVQVLREFVGELIQEVERSWMKLAEAKAEAILLKKAG